MTIVKHEKLNEVDISTKFAGKWVAVVLNDALFSDGERVVVAFGDDWETLEEYSNTQTSEKYPQSSMIFGNPKQYSEDLVCYTP